MPCNDKNKDSVHPVDAAAVEAANKIIDSAFGMANCDEPIARIITDAYAAERDTEVAIDRTVERQDATITRLTTRLTTERAVREKLVEALKEYPCCCRYIPTPSHLPRKLDKCPRCTALASAEALEDVPNAI